MPLALHRAGTPVVVVYGSTAGIEKSVESDVKHLAALFGVSDWVEIKPVTVPDLSHKLATALRGAVGATIVVCGHCDSESGLHLATTTVSGSAFRSCLSTALGSQFRGDVSVILNVACAAQFAALDGHDDTISRLLEFTREAHTSRLWQRSLRKGAALSPASAPGGHDVTVGPAATGSVIVSSSAPRAVAPPAASATLSRAVARGTVPQSKTEHPDPLLQSRQPLHVATHNPDRLTEAIPMAAAAFAATMKVPPPGSNASSTHTTLASHSTTRYAHAAPELDVRWAFGDCEGVLPRPWQRYADRCANSAMDHARSASSLTQQQQQHTLGRQPPPASVGAPATAPAQSRPASVASVGTAKRAPPEGSGRTSQSSHAVKSAPMRGHLPHWDDHGHHDSSSGGAYFGGYPHSLDHHEITDAQLGRLAELWGSGSWWCSTPPEDRDLAQAYTLLHAPRARLQATATEEPQNPDALLDTFTLLRAYASAIEAWGDAATSSSGTQAPVEWEFRHHSSTVVHVWPLSLGPTPSVASLLSVPGKPTMATPIEMLLFEWLDRLRGIARVAADIVPAWPVPHRHPLHPPHHESGHRLHSTDGDAGLRRPGDRPLAFTPSRPSSSGLSTCRVAPRAQAPAAATAASAAAPGRSGSARGLGDSWHPQGLEWDEADRLFDDDDESTPRPLRSTLGSSSSSDAPLGSKRAVTFHDDASAVRAAAFYGAGQQSRQAQRTSISGGASALAAPGVPPTRLVASDRLTRVLPLQSSMPTSATSTPATHLGPPRPTLTVYQAGAGDCALLRWHKWAILIDGGPSAAHPCFADALSDVATLSAVLLTHPDPAHVGGLLGLFHPTVTRKGHHSGLHDKVQGCEVVAHAGIGTAGSVQAGFLLERARAAGAVPRPEAYAADTPIFSRQDGRRTLRIYAILPTVEHARVVHSRFLVQAALRHTSFIGAGLSAESIELVGGMLCASEIDFLQGKVSRRLADLSRQLQRASTMIQAQKRGDAAALCIAEGLMRARGLLDKALLLLQREIGGVALVDAPSCAFRIECCNSGSVAASGEASSTFNLLFTGGAVGEQVLLHLPRGIPRWDYMDVPRHGHEDHWSDALLSKTAPKRVLLSTDGSHHSSVADAECLVGLARFLTQHPGATLYVNHAEPSAPSARQLPIRALARRPRSRSRGEPQRQVLSGGSLGQPHLDGSGAAHGVSAGTLRRSSFLHDAGVSGRASGSGPLASSGRVGWAMDFEDAEKEEGRPRGPGFGGPAYAKQSGLSNAGSSLGRREVHRVAGPIAQSVQAQQRLAASVDRSRDPSLGQSSFPHARLSDEMGHAHDSLRRSVGRSVSPSGAPGKLHPSRASSLERQLAGRERIAEFILAHRMRQLIHQELSKAAASKVAVASAPQPRPTLQAGRSNQVSTSTLPATDAADAELKLAIATQEAMRRIHWNREHKLVIELGGDDAHQAHREAQVDIAPRASSAGSGEAPKVSIASSAMGQQEVPTKDMGVQRRTAPVVAGAKLEQALRDPRLARTHAVTGKPLQASAARR